LHQSRQIPCFVAMMLAAASVDCDEVSRWDDPRQSPKYVPSNPDARPEPDAGSKPDADLAGSCMGMVLQCEQRTEAECNGNGCTYAEGCYETAAARCWSESEQNACESSGDPCEWDEGRCRPEGYSICNSYQTIENCPHAAPPFDCTWGHLCTGDAVSCFDITDVDVCNSNLGCSWF